MRKLLFVLSFFVAVFALPQAASAISLTPSEGGPLTFSPPNDTVVYAAVGDFNGDGKDDIASVGDSMGIYVSLADSDGKGFTLTPQSPIGTGSSGNGRLSVFAGQFGGSSAIDLLVLTNSYPSTLETYLGNGNGTFNITPDATYEIPQGPPFYPSVLDTGSIGDLNGDGWLDFAVGMTHQSFSVALGSPTGQFSTAPGSPHRITVSGATSGGSFTTTAIGDWNGDGDQDLALGFDNHTNTLPGIYSAEGDGTGEFTSSGVPVRQGEPYGWSSSLATVDLDGQPGDDLAITLQNERRVVTLVGGENGLVPNPAEGGAVDFPNGYPYALTVADFDGDGLEDVGVADRSLRSVAILKSDGAGSLSQPEDSPFALPRIDGKNFAANTLTSGDFNGDGAPDVASTSSHSGDPNQARGIDVLINRPQVELSPASLDFPTTRLNQTSSQLVVTVQNLGAAPAAIESIVISGDDASQFSVVGTNCPSSLASGAECGIGVTFTPTEYGSPIASLGVGVSGVEMTSVFVTGLTPAYMDFVPPNGLEFGEATSGYAPDAKTETVVVYSGGGAPLELGVPSIAGPDAADFRVENPDECLTPIEFGDHCAFDITFVPARNTGGLREANLVFASNNDPEFNRPIALAGYARRAEFAVQPGSFDFGEAKIDGATKPTQTFTINSTGPADVPFYGAAITGPNADSFLITENDCPETLAAHDGNCSISVTFDPTYGSATTRNATLEVDAFSSVTTGKTQVALTGTATSDPIPPPVLKPKLTLKLKAPRKVKRGKTLVVTATVKNVGKGAATPLMVRASVPKRLAKAPKAIKVKSLAPGKSVTRKLRIRVKRTARPGAKLRVKVTAASRGARKAATRTARVR